MAYIRQVPEGEFPPDARVAEWESVLAIHGVHPAVLRAHSGLYEELMHGPGPLAPRQRGIIAVVVSARNRCRSCVAHHGAGLRRLGFSDEAVTVLARDWRSAQLEAADHALLEYAVKVSDAPWRVAAGDIKALRAHGFDDEAIHDACVIAAYFAFVTRIAGGLGVELEERGDALSAGPGDRPAGA